MLRRTVIIAVWLGLLMMGVPRVAGAGHRAHFFSYHKAHFFSHHKAHFFSHHKAHFFSHHKAHFWPHTGPPPDTE